MLTNGCKKDSNSSGGSTATGLPVLTTTDITNLTSTAATSGGNITSDGGNSITARGVCWGTVQNPTMASSKTNNGTGTGSYTSSITGLIANSTYYVRAYAVNNKGTSYGNQLSFSPGKPVITTSSVTGITESSASCGGDITTDGGSSITAKGVCWSTSQNPTTVNSKTTDGTGTGTFASDITGLSASTTYYVRAYATNANGTTYGDQVSFTTSNSSIPPSSGSLSATVNGASFVATTAGWSTSYNVDLIVGTVGTKEIGIYCTDFSVGTHPLSVTDMYYYAMYTDVMTSQDWYESQTGTLTITSNNATTGEIKGNFSFVGKFTTSSATVTVTNGQFDVFKIAK